jgi:hypothetical protein
MLTEQPRELVGKGTEFAADLIHLLPLWPKLSFGGFLVRNRIACGA